VLLVPFPFTDQQGIKQRPAVVVSSDAYNANRPDVLIMAITSVLRSTGSALAFAEAVLADWQGAGLIKPSRVQTGVYDHRAAAHHQTIG
jgi:mRNA interferase MazF